MDTVVFDLGKVLLDWSPRYFYEQFFAGDEQALERFLQEAVPPEWIVEMDAGKPAVNAMVERRRACPEHAELIGQWKKGWPQMLRGEIRGSVEILAELRARGRRLYALTNFSVETFPIARERFAFLGWFDDIVVSGEHGIVKPDPRIYALTNSRCRLEPARTVFVDDSPLNVDAARASGMHALHFTDAAKLRAELASLGLLDR
jgi:2-haloacid dehalogenase